MNDLVNALGLELVVIRVYSRSGKATKYLYWRFGMTVSLYSYLVCKGSYLSHQWAGFVLVRLGQKILEKANKGTSRTQGLELHNR
jgi:hypothetical protein